MNAVNTSLPAGGWMPGEKQYIIGPPFSIGDIALHMATMAEPSTTDGCCALICEASWTAVCGLD